MQQNPKNSSRIRTGRIPVSVMDELAQSIQPKERLYSNGCRDLSCKLCTKLSYRDAAEMLNRFQHRDASQTMKLRTLSGCMERMGSQISEELEKTTGNIQNGQEAYVLTACGMKKAMRSMLAFLIFNGLLRSRLVFFTDGARNIKNSIEEMFAFHPYTVILDWYHLKKKYQELLSMAVKGKDARNKTLGKLLRILWVGDVKGAISYLEGLPSSMIKNPK